MNNNFWKLYGAGLLGNSIADFEPMTEKEWSGLWEVAKYARMSGVMLDGINHLPVELQPPSNLLLDWSVELAKATLRHFDNDAVIADLFERWRNVGVHPVLLKGQGFARMYPEPKHRDVGDIDIFVCPKEWERAMQVVRSLPLDRQEFPDIGKHLEFFYRNKCIELHRRSAEVFHCKRLDPLYQEWSDMVLPVSAEGFYMRSDSDGANRVWITVPPHDFNLFYTFMHLWGHVYLGPTKARSIGDWALLLHRHHADVDVEQLEIKLRQFKLLEPWQLMGCFLVRYLGVDSRDIPLYNESMMADVERIYRCINREMAGFGPESHSRNPLVRKSRNLKRKLRYWKNRVAVFPIGKSLRDLADILLLGATFLFKNSELEED